MTRARTLAACLESVLNEGVKIMEIKGNSWTLYHTIGAIICGPVSIGDVIEMPGGRDSVTVTGGRPPQRVKDSGAVYIAGGMEARPGALGMVWKHDVSGGLAEFIG